jgi:WD40 repeat protein
LRAFDLKESIEIVKLRRKDHEGNISCIQSNQKHGNTELLLASGSWDTSVKVYAFQQNLQQIELRHTLSEHSQAVWSVDFITATDLLSG